MLMSLKKSNSIESILFLWVPILFLVIIEYFFVINTNENWTHFYILQLLVIYILIVVKSVAKFGFLHLYSLLLFTTCLFSYSGIFYSLFDSLYDFRSIMSIINFTISESVLQKSILVYTIFLLILDLTFAWSTASSKEKIQIKFSYNYEYAGLLLMKLFVVFALYRAYLEVKVLSIDRLLQFQVGNSSDLGVPIFVRLFSNFFNAGYLLFLASLPKRKKFVLVSCIYFITIVPYILIGNRMEIACVILFMLWFLNKFYDYKIRLTKLFVVLLFLITIFQLVALNRSDDLIGHFSILDILKLFLLSQSISFYVLPLYMEFKDICNTNPYPFILDSPISGFTNGVGQSYETLKVRSSLGHHLTYNLNPEYYLSGKSIGTSHIAETFEFGLVGIILGAILLALFLKYFNSMVLRNRYLLMFSYTFFYSIISSPRASLLPSLYLVGRDFILCFVFLFLINYLRKKKNHVYENDT
jgi:oligosaccharide repeat unit polymerase